MEQVRVDNTAKERNDLFVLKLLERGVEILATISHTAEVLSSRFVSNLLSHDPSAVAAPADMGAYMATRHHYQQHGAGVGHIQNYIQSNETSCKCGSYQS